MKEIFNIIDDRIMKLSPTKRGILIIALCIVMLGFICPSLVSSDSTVAVIMGIIFGVVSCFGAYRYLKPILEQHTEKADKIVMILAVFTMVGCSKVPAGNVGVKVYLLGGEKGVDTEQLPVGRYWLTWNEELFLFPTYTQNYVWTANPAESSPTDESIRFQSTEGLSISADIGIAYRIDPDQAASIFQKYRKGVEEITDIHLRNIVRSSLVSQASTRKVEDIYGPGKSELMEDVKSDVRASVSEIGIVVEDLYWIGDPRLPPKVIESIDLKIQATQDAIRAENQVRQVKAEAQKRIAKAEGDAEAVRLSAIAEAEAIRIKGDAIRENPSIIQLNAINKWNGVLPTMMGGGSPVPFVSLKGK